MNIAPEPHVLESMRSQRLGWAEIIGELIDNGLDWAGNQIKIYLDAKKVQIVDDGVGCDDLRVMFTPGAHRRHPGGGGLGRYGIGFKDAALSLWGMTTVESVKNGKCLSATVDWEKVERAGSWEVPDAIETPAVGKPSGTIVTFQKITKTVPTGKELEKLISQLSFLFAPAIHRGKQIIFHHHKLPTPHIAQPFEWPVREDIIDVTVTVCDRPVRIYVGIVPEGVPNPRAGLSYCFRHRVIIPSCSLGCGDKSAARIAGFVELKSEAWRLSKNKDDISEYRDELVKAVEEVCKPLLEKASHQARCIQLKDLNLKITCRLRALFGGTKRTGKEKREQGETSGTAEPRETGRKRERAQKRQPGDKLLDNLSRGVRFEIGELPEEDGIWRVDSAGNTITLAENHPRIQTILRLSSELQEDHLYTIALTALVDHVRIMDERGTNRMLPGIGDEAEENKLSVFLGRLLASLEAKTAEA